MNIGIFDSGLGGLSVFKSIAAVLPEHNLIYLGDNARTPYGDRSQETIYRFTEEAVNYLFTKKDCRLVILACNTASAKALRQLQQEFLPKNFPEHRLLGVIRPIIEEIGRLNAAKVAVLATRSTVESGAYQRELNNICPNTKIVLQAAPLLVPLIEEGWVGHETTKRILEEYLKPIINNDLDILVPACTHYSLLYDQLRELAGPKVTVLDTPTLIAESLRRYLHNHPEISSRLIKDSKREYLVTDYSEHYQILAEQLFGEKISFQRVDL